MNKINKILQMLVSIRNAYVNNRKYSRCRYSNFLLKLLMLLYKEGFIKGFKIKEDYLFIYLKYLNNKPFFSLMENISTPSLKKHLTMHNYVKYKKRYDVFFLSSSLDIISSAKARDKHIGGLLLFGLKFNTSN